MDAIMDIIQPIIDTIAGLISGEVDISEIFAWIQDIIAGGIG